MREQLAKALDWGEAHADFDRAVDGLGPELHGRRIKGLPHSPWEILEHLRITQHDILDFARNPNYVEITWPDDYWPPTPAPPTASAWDASVAAFQSDRAALKALTLDPAIELTGRIAHGTGQTYLREVLLVLDHNAYHVAELVALRRLLGAWD
jgi:hypothetical protein